MRDVCNAKGNRKPSRRLKYVAPPPPLPLEIWRIICDQLAEDNFRGSDGTYSDNRDCQLRPARTKARQALKALCRVSWGIAKMAQAALFKCYHMGDHQERRTFIQYLGAVLDSPRLAGYTKELVLDEPVFPGYKGYKRELCPLLTTKAEFAAAYARVAARLGFDESRFPLDFMEQGELQPRSTARLPSTLLLAPALLPNLERLGIGMTSKQGRPFKLLQQLHALGVVEPFWRVKELTLKFYLWEAPTIVLTRLAPLLALVPNLTTLRLYAFPGLDAADQGFIEVVREGMPPGLHTLEVRDGYLEDHTVDALLRCCPSGLERFVYVSTVVRPDFPQLGAEVTPRQLVRRLLARSGDTLRAVELDYSEERDRHRERGNSEDYETNLAMADEEYGTKLTMADFAGFAALETMVHLPYVRDDSWSWPSPSPSPD
ncbi:hypothetical protein PG984_000135 [Apiospora sp. TS-2023a]